MSEGARRRARILLAHGDPEVRAEIRARIGPDMDVREVGTGQDALGLARTGGDVLVVDDELTDEQGDALLPTMLAIDPDLPVIVVGAEVTVARAVAAVKRGAFDYLSGPSVPDEVPIALRLALDRRRRRSEIMRQRPVDEEPACLSTLIGESVRMQETKKLIRKVASSASWIALVSGESGTGKHLAAAALHELGVGAGSTLVPVRCAEALPGWNWPLGDDGAWSHGDTTTATLLLDEVDRASPDVQGKLLDGIEKYAATQSSRTLRIIATSTRDLRSAVRDGAFRASLYYHLSLVEIHVPALRDREGDVELLARHFAELLGQRIGRFPTFTRAALSKLTAFWWPGNVRELKRSVERAVLLADRSALDADDFDISSTEAPSPAASAPPTPADLPPDGVDLRELEVRLVRQALRRTNGNLTKAAALLGLNRDQIRYRMLKFRL